MKIKAGKRFFHFAVILLGIVVLILGCAKSGMPPGGPEDRTPPDILSTQPASGSVQVPTDSRIVIRFSEAIERESARKALFISPVPDPEPKIKIKSDAIVITPRGNLQENKTYVVTIGTDLKDAHRVNLEQSISLAFSTGTSIDSGTIAGTVFRDGKRTAGISLALFEWEPEKATTVVDSLIPGYLTQSGEGGLFSFSYLPSGEFYLVAFDDKNKNRRINPSREMIGLPFSGIAIDPENRSLTGIDIQLHMDDTSKLELRSVSINPDRLLKVRLSRKIDPVRAESLFAAAAIVKEADSTSDIDIIDFAALSKWPASDYVVAAGAMDVGQAYRLILDMLSLYPQVPDTSRYLSYPFEYPDGQDQSPPVIIETTPTSGALNIHPDSLLCFRFSEAVDTVMLAKAVRLIDADDDSSEVAITQSDMFSVAGKPAGGLDYGRQYRLLIDATSIRDYNGNQLSDSAVTITFSTIGLDTLGQLSGEVQFSVPGKTACPVVAAFTPIREGVAAMITIPPGQLRYIVDLLPGYYTVSAYLDHNENGKYDYGTIIPYRPAERFTAPADTFRVRSRFETAGVLLEF